MKPLVILICTFILAIVLTRFFFGYFDYHFSGKIALAGMLVFTAIGHFAFTKGMARMLPEFVPFPVGIVYFTGFLEILAAAAIFFPSLCFLTGCLLIAFFIMVLPANIYASWKGIDYRTGKLGGNGRSYLWFRIPFQILLIVWTYFFVIR